MREHGNGVEARYHRVEAPVSVEIRDVEDSSVAAQRIDRPAVEAAVSVTKQDFECTSGKDEIAVAVLVEVDQLRPRLCGSDGRAA